MITRRQLLVGVLLAVLLLGVGTADVVSQYDRVNTAATTTGTVQTASVEEDSLDIPQLINDEFYRTNLTYTYTVDGERYTGQGPFPAWASGTERATVVTVERFESGERVTVSYRPADPSESYLVGRYALFPGFAALIVAPYLLAVLTTPGFRLETILDVALRGVTDQPAHRTPKLADPVDTTTGDGVEWLPLTGTAEWVVWGTATLAALAVVAVYLAVAPPGTRRLGYAVGLVVVGLTGVRTAFRRR